MSLDGVVEYLSEYPFVAKRFFDLLNSKEITDYKYLIKSEAIQIIRDYPLPENFKPIDVITVLYGQNKIKLNFFEALLRVFFTEKGEKIPRDGVTIDYIKSSGFYDKYCADVKATGFCNK